MMIIVVVALTADFLLQWPISPLALALGGVFLGAYLSQDGRYRHYPLFMLPSSSP